MNERLHLRADACGIERHWRDADGREQIVSDATLEAVVDAVGESGVQRDALPAMLVAVCGGNVEVPIATPRAEATGEDGATVPLVLDERGFIAPDRPGYYDLAIDGHATRLAVAPPCAPPIDRDGTRRWGLSMQIPALRSSRAAPFGTFGELAAAIGPVACAGADALAINPVHALFPGDGRNFSPYSPSSRIHLNGAMGDPGLAGLPPLTEVAGADLIEWSSALPERLAQLRATFAGLTEESRRSILADPALADQGVRRHALFDALYCHFVPTGARRWQDWPTGFGDPASAAVARFARDNHDEIEFHLFVQWLARKSLVACGDVARMENMAVGLIADLAVGVHPGGSDCWGMPDAMLRGLRLGAPPDPLGPQGQEWGITTFSPAGLQRTGFEPFIAMVRAAFAGMGGLRIDHAFGLQRMWVVPEGAEATDGAYLRYPFANLLHLVVLEAHRADAAVIAENLGTAPPGYTDAVESRGIMGMEVLWFARAEDHGFIGAADYSPRSVSMTGTHDTPTVAGWWTGVDLDWAAKLGRLPAGIDRAKAESIRDWDRGLLWSSIGSEAVRPSTEEAEPAVDAAISHIACAASPLALFPFEDLLGEIEQPNLPGTTEEHPNWSRRYDRPTTALLQKPATVRRIENIRKARPCAEE